MPEIGLVTSSIDSTIKIYDFVREKVNVQALSVGPEVWAACSGLAVCCSCSCHGVLGPCMLTMDSPPPPLCR